MPPSCFLRICLVVSSCLYGGLTPTLSAAQGASPVPLLAEPLRGLAEQILNQSNKIHCPPPECKILITNFVSPDGQTSKFGIQVADALSTCFSEQGKIFSTVDRSALQSFLQRQRLSARVQSEEPVGRWLARQLGGDAVIVGKIRPKRDGLELSISVLNATEEKRKPLTLKTTLDAETSSLDLSPTDGLEPLNPKDRASGGEDIFEAGVQGVSIPKCFYMPNPTYTEDARASKFSGIVMLEALIGANGEVSSRRVLKGAPYGLNESAIETLSTWKCQPAQLDGKPVSVIVTFEVSFRLY